MTATKRNFWIFKNRIFLFSWKTRQKSQNSGNKEETRVNAKFAAGGKSISGFSIKCILHFSIAFLCCCCYSDMQNKQHSDNVTEWARTSQRVINRNMNIYRPKKILFLKSEGNFSEFYSAFLLNCAPQKTTAKNSMN